MMASPVSTTLDHQRTFLDKLNRTYKLLVQNVRSIHFDFFKMQLLTFQLPKSDHSFSPLHIYLHQSQVIRISVRSRQELLCEEFVHSCQLSEFVLILMSYWIISYTINFRYRSQRVKGLNHAVTSLVLFARQNTSLEKNVFYLVMRLGQRKRLTSARQLVSGAERINQERREYGEAGEPAIITTYKLNLGLHKMSI